MQRKIAVDCPDCKIPLVDFSAASDDYSGLCEQCRRIFNKEYLLQMQPIQVKKIGPEFKIKLVAKFHEWNRHPVRADWYEIELSSGPVTMTIRSDIFLKLSDAAQQLLNMERL